MSAVAALAVQPAWTEFPAEPVEIDVDDLDIAEVYDIPQKPCPIIYRDTFVNRFADSFMRQHATIDEGLRESLFIERLEKTAQMYHNAAERFCRQRSLKTQQRFIEILEMEARISVTAAEAVIRMSDEDISAHYKRLNRPMFAAAGEVRRQHRLFLIKSAVCAWHEAFEITGSKDLLQDCINWQTQVADISGNPYDLKILGVYLGLAGLTQEARGTRDALDRRGASFRPFTAPL